MLAFVQINEYNKMCDESFEVTNYMDYLTTMEMSEIWGISSRRIALLCEQGRIEGVIKKGKTWLIPSDTSKPNDLRKTNKKDGNE